MRVDVDHARQVDLRVGCGDDAGVGIHRVIQLGGVHCFLRARGQNYCQRQQANR